MFSRSYEADILTVVLQYVWFQLLKFQLASSVKNSFRAFDFRPFFDVSILLPRFVWGDSPSLPMEYSWDSENQFLVNYLVTPAK